MRTSASGSGRILKRPVRILNIHVRITIFFDRQKEQFLKHLNISIVSYI